MMRWIPYVLAVMAALLVIAGAAIRIPPPPSEESLPEWLIQAESPAVFGGGDAAYGYAGSPVYDATGEMRIAWTPSRGGTVDFRIELGEEIGTFTRPSAVYGSASLDTESPVFVEQSVLGGTGLGLIPLPVTHALLAGEARFEIVATSESGAGDPESIPGWWMVADALRRNDGAIRQSGLIYSPLLRDQSGFSDASRTEATLILGDAEQPFLQVVFTQVRVVQSPSRKTPDPPITP